MSCQHPDGATLLPALQTGSGAPEGQGADERGAGGGGQGAGAGVHAALVHQDRPS